MTHAHGGLWDYEEGSSEMEEFEELSNKHAGDL